MEINLALLCGSHLESVRKILGLMQHSPRHEPLLVRLDTGDVAGGGGGGITERLGNISVIAVNGLIVVSRGWGGRRV